jgi:precorrin-6B C5,15-methyltransferase / cobalt-precorrin-6B C5,C15-methyltransferase
MTDAQRLVIVGIGADGWTGLGEPARAAILAAEQIVGSTRQLELLPTAVGAVRRLWPSPMDPLLDELAGGTSEGICVLASGDPMLYGVGATLARRMAPQRLLVHSHPSALALACARLGWPAADVELISVLGRPLETIVRSLQPPRRLLAYLTGTQGAAALARVLCEHGFGPSRLVVLEQLGGPAERIVHSTALEWGQQPVDPLHAVAIECRAAPGSTPRPRVPGLPDDAYDTDGQLTKQPVRAIALAALGPLPGELLWDVGAGSGSVAIEWLRAEPSARAIAIEANVERIERIGANARTLGVPHLEVHHGRAPHALRGLPAPDAVFIGGGVSEPEVIELCWETLRHGGRLVANAVTLEGERALLDARAHHGGEMLRVELSDAEPLGGFSCWRPRRPVVQWSIRKERS